MNSLLDPWCNGNTADFGSVIPGSNPGGSTINPDKKFLIRVYCCNKFYDGHVSELKQVAEGGIIENPIAASVEPSLNSEPRFEGEGKMSAPWNCLNKNVDTKNQRNNYYFAF